MYLQVVDSAWEWLLRKLSWTHKKKGCVKCEKWKTHPLLHNKLNCKRQGELRRFLIQSCFWCWTDASLSIILCGPWFHPLGGFFFHYPLLLSYLITCMWIARISWHMGQPSHEMTKDLKSKTFWQWKCCDVSSALSKICCSRVKAMIAPDHIHHHEYTV